MAVDPTAFRQTMATWATGVSIVTAVSGGQRYGMTVSSFTSLSLNPTLVSYCVGKNNQSYDAMVAADSFVVNILSTEQVQLGKIFAGIIPTEDRFANLEIRTAETGAPILPDVVAWLDCKKHTIIDGGDHTIIIGEVVATESVKGKRSLLYANRTWGQFEGLPTRTFKHVVMMRLKENTEENAAAITEGLNSLVGVVPQIRRLEVGRNVISSERAYDLALTVVFDSQEDMEAYQTHPEHVRVLNEIIRPRISGSAAADYYDA